MRKNSSSVVVVIVEGFACAAARLKRILSI